MDDIDDDDDEEEEADQDMRDTNPDPGELDEDVLKFDLDLEEDGVVHPTTMTCLGRSFPCSLSAPVHPHLCILYVSMFL